MVKKEQEQEAPSIINQQTTLVNGTLLRGRLLKGAEVPMPMIMFIFMLMDMIVPSMAIVVVLVTVPWTPTQSITVEEKAGACRREVRMAMIIMLAAVRPHEEDGGELRSTTHTMITTSHDRRRTIARPGAILSQTKRIFTKETDTKMN